jgi:hypothetical protein
MLGNLPVYLGAPPRTGAQRTKDRHNPRHVRRAYSEAKVRGS